MTRIDQMRLTIYFLNFERFSLKCINFVSFWARNCTLRKNGVEFHQKENGILVRLSANEYNNPPLEMKLLGLKFIADTV